ncbi:MAG: hypothetical protein ACI9WU_002660, partial [Myxococcota bacterium]
EDVPNCCAGDAACDDGDACTADGCVNSVCESKATPDCCVADAQCDDGEACTTDACQNNACVNTVDPDCCEEEGLLGSDFSSLPDNWTVTNPNGDQVQWQLSSLQASSPALSLWFGNKETGNFSSENGAVSGTIATPVLALPAGENLLMTFQVWLDVEQPNGFDSFEVRVVTTGGDPAGTMVWDKSAAAGLQQWVPVQINLTGFAGSSVQVVFSFDSVDGIQNETQGVFVDDFAISKSCQDLGGICVFDGECDDGAQCTSDSCDGGQCVNNDIPDCCQVDAECDDQYACTTDVCNGGTCQYAQEIGCCVFDGECDDGNPCTADSCQNNACSSTPVPGGGCCTQDVDCDDGDACTTGTCQANQCELVADTGPGCCTAESLFAADFGDATLQGFTVIQDGSAAKWSVQAKRFFSPPFSLYFGIPGTWNYETEPAASGVALSPEIEIPLTAASVAFSFQSWWDTAQFGGNFGDIYNVKVLSGGILSTVWTAPGGAEQVWTKATIDLTPFKGQAIQIQWNFQAVSTPFGQPGEGVFVDDVDVSTVCE